MVLLLFLQTNVTSHSLTVSGLIPDTVYHFRVKSKDLADNVSTSDDFTFTTPPDETPPILSNIVADYITDTRAIIKWDTDELCNSEVEFGTDLSYGQTIVDTQNVTLPLHRTDWFSSEYDLSLSSKIRGCVW